MNGFESPNRMSSSEETETFEVTRVSNMSTEEIERCVKRGRQLRNAHFAEWGRRLVLTLASVFRGPGRILPPNMSTGRFAR